MSHNGNALNLQKHSRLLLLKWFLKKINICILIHYVLVQKDDLYEKGVKAVFKYVILCFCFVVNFSSDRLVALQCVKIILLSMILYGIIFIF